MTYWLKVILCTILPVIILYYFAWPYYDQSDDAYNTFKHVFFQVSVFIVPIVLVTMNYFFARNRNPYKFLWNAAIVLATTFLFVEQLGDMYRTSFRWLSTPEFQERINFFGYGSVVATILLLLTVQFLLVSKKRIRTL